MRWARALLAAGCLGSWAAASQDPGVVADVPYLASPQIVVDEMLRLAQVGPRDIVYDLGSGDGRVVITAAKKFGARGVGIEIDPAMARLARDNAARAGLAERVRIVQQDLFATDLEEATVITLYLAPYLNQRLRERLLGLRPGTRIVSHSSDMGEWQPDLKTAVRKDVLLWYVPARVEGSWQTRLPEGLLEIDFRQRFQRIAGQARLGGKPVSVWEPRLRGEELEFVLSDTEGERALYFTGRVGAQVIDGTVSRDVGARRQVDAWRATKAR